MRSVRNTKASWRSGARSRSAGRKVVQGLSRSSAQSMLLVEVAVLAAGGLRRLRHCWPSCNIAALPRQAHEPANRLPFRFRCKLQGLLGTPLLAGFRGGRIRGGRNAGSVTGRGAGIGKMCPHGARDRSHRLRRRPPAAAACSRRAGRCARSPATPTRIEPPAGVEAVRGRPPRRRRPRRGARRLRTRLLPGALDGGRARTGTTSPTATAAPPRPSRAPRRAPGSSGSSTSGGIAPAGARSPPTSRSRLEVERDPARRACPGPPRCAPRS